jgi:hypothetical protein
MKTWHAVAFLIVTARGRVGSPWASLFLRVLSYRPGKINAQRLALPILGPVLKAGCA